MTRTLAGSAPTHLPRDLQDSWVRLVQRPAPGPPFHAELVAHLPAPVRRWLCSTIEPGTPLRRCVELQLHGRIKLGGWRGFTARQVLTADQDYIWAERTRLLGLPVAGFDRLVDGEGQMRHWTVGHLPVLNAAGPDVTVSASGRMAAELCYLPSLALDERVGWRGLDADSAVADVHISGHRYEVTLSVSASGEPQRVSLDRWAKLDGRRFRMHRFVAELGRLRRFDGYAIPTSVRAGYADVHGRVNPFIEQFVDQASFH